MCESKYAFAYFSLSMEYCRVAYVQTSHKYGEVCECPLLADSRRLFDNVSFLGWRCTNHVIKCLLYGVTQLLSTLIRTAPSLHA